MIELVVAAAGGIATAAATALGARWLRSRRRAAEQRDHDRFSHYVHPDMNDVVVGTSLEPAGAVPHHEPLVTVDDSFAVRLGADRMLHIPAGAQLQVRAFGGARRRILDHITTPQGIVARVSFVIPRDVGFWILDAPAWGQLRETASGSRGLRGRGPWEITTRLRPIPSGDAVTQVTAHHVAGPAWLLGLADAGDWIAPRSADAREIVLIDLSDPSAPPGDSPRDDDVAGIVPCLAAAVWLRTGARVRFVTPYMPGRGRMVARRRSPWSGDEIAEMQRGAVAVIHGAAEADLARSGATLTIRTGGARPWPTVTAPLHDLVDDVVETIIARGLAPAAGPHAAGMTMPVQLDDHARLLGLIVRMRMMSPALRAIPRKPIGEQATALGEIMAAAEPDCVPARLAWIAAALSAHAISDLGAHRRAAVLDAVRSATGPSDPLYLLAPRVLLVLGQRDEATAVRDARRLHAGGDYRDADAYGRWLDGISGP